MSNYRRVRHPGGLYFFTVNLWQRRNNNDLLVKHIDALRDAVRRVKHKHPFIIHAWVVLPDHIHCVIELPQGDTDFSIRLRLIKTFFAKSLPKQERLSSSRQKRGERGIWQRRFWEHWIRDGRDYQAHMDYVHINPLKHGLVEHVRDWPYSTWHSLVDQGVYPPDWSGGCEDELPYTD